MEIKFKTKMWKSGTGYAIIIPKRFVDEGTLDFEKEYQYTVSEVVSNE